MAGGTLTTVDNILKEYYLGPVQEQLNNEVLLVQRLEARSEDLVGRVAIVPLHTGRSGGIGAVSESAALPSAGNQTYAKAQYDLKYLYGRVQVTGPSMAKTKSDVGSFLQILKAELDGIRADLSKDLARQTYGTGDAIIAVGDGTAITGSGTFAAPYVVMLTDWEPLKKGQIYAGSILDGVTYSSGTPTIAAVGWTVKSTSLVGAASSTISVYGGTGTVAINQSWTRTGATTTGFNKNALAGRSNEVDGLRRIITTTAPSSSTVGNAGYQTLGQIDANADQYWDNQRTAVGGALTLQAMQTMANTVRTKGGQTSMIITSLGVMREFYRLLTFVNGSSTPVYDVSDGTMDFKAGFNSVSYNGVPVVGDIDAPFGNMYFIDESTLKVFSDQDWHFLDADGQTLRQVIGYDAYEAIMTRYMNLGATNRTKNGVLSGITVNGSADTGV